MNPTTVVAGCSTIMQGLSAFGSVLLLCFTAIAIVCTAICVNFLLKKYWQPVTMFRYVTRIVEMPSHTAETKEIREIKRSRGVS